MTVKGPFNPHVGSNQTDTATTSSQEFTIDAAAKSVRLVNQGAELVYFRIGTGSQTATAADTPVRAASELIIAKADGQNTIAYLAATATSAIHVQTGEGGY